VSQQVVISGSAGSVEIHTPLSSNAVVRPGVKIFVILPLTSSAVGSVVVIDYFDTSQDILDISRYLKIFSMEDLSYSDNPSTIYFPDHRMVVLRNVNAFSLLTDKNFFFARPVEGTAQSFWQDRTVYILFGLSVVVLGLLWMFFHWDNLDEEKEKKLDVGNKGRNFTDSWNSSDEEENHSNHHLEVIENPNNSNNEQSQENQQTLPGDRTMIHLEAGLLQQQETTNTIRNASSDGNPSVSSSEESSSHSSQSSSSFSDLEQEDFEFQQIDDHDSEQHQQRSDNKDDDDGEDEEDDANEEELWNDIYDEFADLDGIRS
jgi:hypothetical protein